MSTDPVQSPTYSPFMWVLFAKSIQTNLPAGLAQSKEEDETPVFYFFMKRKKLQGCSQGSCKESASECCL